MGYRSDIDGLRALAVLAVILNHAGLLPGGYLGVDVFFVISGFVITRSLEGETGSFGGVALRFYARRVKRLLPALALCVAVSAVAICLVDPNPIVSLLTGIAAMFGGSNLFLFVQATDYFGAPAGLNIFTHTWSLGAEEQFYLLFPALFWFQRKWVRELSLLALFVAVVLNVRHPSATFFLVRFWEIGAGCLLAGRVKIPPILPLLGLCAVFLLDRPLMGSVLATGLTSALIVSGGHRFQNHPVAVYIGKLSYSLYLWHWPVFILAKWTVGISALTLPFLLPVVFLLAAGSYHFVEPFRGVKWAPWRVLIFGAFLSVATAGLLVGLVKFHGRLFLGHEVATAGRDYVTSSGVRASDCSLVKLKADFHPERCFLGKPVIYVTGDSHALDLFPTLDAAKIGAVATWQNGCLFPPQGPDYCSLPLTIIERIKPKVLVIRQNYSPKLATGDLGRYIRSLRAFLQANPGLRVVMVAPAPKSRVLDAGGLCSPQPFRPVVPAICKHPSEPASSQLARRKEYMLALRDLTREYPNFSVYDPFFVLCAQVGKDCTLTGRGPLYRDESHLTLEGSVALAPSFRAALSGLQ